MSFHGFWLNGGQGLLTGVLVYLIVKHDERRGRRMIELALILFVCAVVIWIGVG